MEFKVIVECNGCQTYREETLKTNEKQVVRGCSCGYFGEEDMEVFLDVRKH